MAIISAKSLLRFAEGLYVKAECLLLAWLNLIDFESVRQSSVRMWNVNYIAKSSQSVLFTIFFCVATIRKKILRLEIQVCSDESEYGFKSERN